MQIFIKQKNPEEIAFDKQGEQMTEIIPIPFKGLCSNCYLLKNKNDYVLIDTSCPGKKKKIKSFLQKHGCNKTNLKMIILTHGDFDHCGSTAYLQSKFNCQIAMHKSDAQMIETGNMFINKNKKNIFAAIFIKIILRIKKFTPDIFLEEGQKLEEFDPSIQILTLPGHTIGSIGLLVGNSLISGDLFENRKNPRLYYVDDEKLINQSLEKLKKYNISTVYPGHGTPFNLKDFKPNK